MRRSLVPVLACILAVACSRPVPTSRRDYVGVWTAPDRHLAIAADGRLEYQRKSDGTTLELGGRIREIEADQIRVGIWPITSTFRVDRGPHLEGGHWKMTIDGVELRRTEADTAPTPASQAALVEECTAGRGSSCSSLAALHAKGETADFKQAFHYAQLACNAGDVQGCGYLGDMYLVGAGVDRDVHGAQVALERACTGKIMRACFNLASLYADAGVLNDPTKAAELNQRACDGGDADACHNLALAYQQGLGVTKDVIRALQLLQKACESDPAVSCAYLGSLYDGGQVVEQDRPKAVELYRRACGANEPTGCYNFAAKLLEGELLNRDLQLAAKLFEKVCSSDGTGAEGTTPKKLSCYNLGTLYASGHGVPRSLERAAALFGTACDLDFPTGCHNLGNAYMAGAGVKEDSSKAVALFEKACAAGMAQSCTNLGNCYIEGRGVARDPHRAAELFKKACSGGSGKACDNSRMTTL